MARRAQAEPVRHRRAALYRQGLGEFFLDDLCSTRPRSSCSRPRCRPLLPVLRDNARVARLDTPAYNMVAYPWAQTYQQSNQWAIETLAMAQEPARARASAPRPGCSCRATSRRRCACRRSKRLGARDTAANIAFDDHPNDKRFADRIETVTVDSVFAG